MSRNGERSIFTLDSIGKQKYLVEYLEKYPLKSRKHIAYSKWKKLYEVIKDGYRGKTHSEIEKLAQGINEYVEEDKVQISE